MDTKNHPENINWSKQNKMADLWHFQNTKLTVASPKQEVEKDERDRQRDRKEESLNLRKL